MRGVRNLAFASVSLWSLAAPALAQETAKADDSDSKEIIVSARRRDEVVQDVPIVINAVTAETIEKLNLRKFEDIQSVVPGLQMRNNANGIGTVSSVRGVNFDVNVSGNSGTIEYYFNDASISSGTLFTAMFDIGQIEVLRGPQGTLRGRASPSGSITIATHKPDLNRFGGFVDATVNSNDGQNLNAALNAPIIPGKLAVRVAGLFDWGQGNRVHSLNSLLDPSDRTKAGRISVRAEPFDFLSLNGTYQYVERASQTFGQVESFANIVPGVADGVVHINPADRLSTSKSPTFNTQKFEFWNWQAQLRYGGQRLVYIGSRVSQDLLSIGADSDGANLFPALSITGRTKTGSVARSHEIRLQNEDRVAGMFDYVLGYFYNKLDSMPTSGHGTTLANNTILNIPGRPVSLIVTPINQGSSSVEKSYFGNVIAHLGDATELSAGARHISYTSDHLLSINGVFNPSANYTDSYEKWIYNASLKHRFSPNILAYVSFGTSWRPGGVAVGDFSVNQSQREFDMTHQGPETSKSYEIGIKTNFLNNRARFNISAYQQDYDGYPFHPNSTIYYISFTQSGANQLASVSAGGAAFNFVAETKVRVHGVEAEASFQATPHFNIGGNLNYALGRIKDGILPCNDLNGDGVPDVLSAAPTIAQLQAIPNYATNHLALCTGSPRSSFSPVWSGTAHFDYNLPLEKAFGGTEAFARGLLSWYGSTENDPNNAFDDIRSYARFNLYMGLRKPDGRWEVSLYGKNLFNGLNVTSRGTAQQGTSFQSATGAQTVLSPYVGIGTTEPREFGITMRFALGSR